MQSDVIEKFSQFLRLNGKSEKTIENYCSYVAKAEDCMHCAAEGLVRNEDVMGATIKGIRNLTELTEGSKSCYICGLKWLYRFVCSSGFKDDSGTATEWYQVVMVDSVDALFKILKGLYGRQSLDSFEKRSWAFRGQGEAQWQLETSLRRGIQSADMGKFLRLCEKEAMWEFKREASKYIEYQDYEGVNLLALMQHYGCKTRLLDFSMSYWVALYMAVVQNENLFRQGCEYVRNHMKEDDAKCQRPDYALWAVNLNALVDYSKSSEGRSVEDEYEDADAIVCGRKETGPGIKVVFPSRCNARISAQDGLFLMPTDLSKSFSENLKSCLSGMNIKGNIENKMVSDIGADISCSLSPIYKFVFSYDTLKEMKESLRGANISAKNVYPDLIGLGYHISEIIDDHR